MPTILSTTLWVSSASSRKCSTTPGSLLEARARPSQPKAELPLCPQRNSPHHSSRSGDKTKSSLILPRQLRGLTNNGRATSDTRHPLPRSTRAARTRKARHSRLATCTTPTRCKQLLKTFAMVAGAGRTKITRTRRCCT